MRLKPRRVRVQPHQALPKLTPELAILSHLAAVLDRRDQAEGRPSTLLFEVLRSLIADEGAQPEELNTLRAVNTVSHLLGLTAAEAAKQRMEGQL